MGAKEETRLIERVHNLINSKMKIKSDIIQKDKPDMRDFNENVKK